MTAHSVESETEVSSPFFFFLSPRPALFLPRSTVDRLGCVAYLSLPTEFSTQRIRPAVSNDDQASWLLPP